MKKSIYVVGNKGVLSGARAYLKSCALDGAKFDGEWTFRLEEAKEFAKDEAVALATRLNNNWNGRNHRALQKCRLKA